MEHPRVPALDALLLQSAARSAVSRLLGANEASPSSPNESAAVRAADRMPLRSLGAWQQLSRKARGPLVSPADDEPYNVVAVTSTPPKPAVAAAAGMAAHSRHEDQTATPLHSDGTINEAVREAIDERSRAALATAGVRLQQRLDRVCEIETLARRELAALWTFSHPFAQQSTVDQHRRFDAFVRRFIMLEEVQRDANEDEFVEDLIILFEMHDAVTNVLAQTPRPSSPPPRPPPASVLSPRSPDPVPAAALPVHMQASWRPHAAVDDIDISTVASRTANTSSFRLPHRTVEQPQRQFQEVHPYAPVSEAPRNAAVISAPTAPQQAASAGLLREPLVPPRPLETSGDSVGHGSMLFSRLLHSDVMATDFAVFPCKYPPLPGVRRPALEPRDVLVSTDGRSVVSLSSIADWEHRVLSRPSLEEHWVVVLRGRRRVHVPIHTPVPH
jgi:hypothetical protein